MKVHSEDKKYTYSDYLTWPDYERWEIYEGAPSLLSAPTWQHQAIARELLTQFNIFLKGSSCQVFAAPFDLRLPIGDQKDEETTFVVQPDLLVICDKKGLKGTGYYGTPALIIEISSPATARNDKVLKFNHYERSGVREYWIVEPEGKFISVFTLQESGRFGRPEVYTESTKVKVTVFPDLVIDLGLVFEGI